MPPPKKNNNFRTFHLNTFNFLKSKLLNLREKKIPIFKGKKWYALRFYANHYLSKVILLSPFCD